MAIKYQNRLAHDTLKLCGWFGNPDTGFPETESDITYLNRNGDKGGWKAFLGCATHIHYVYDYGRADQSALMVYNNRLKKFLYLTFWEADHMEHAHVRISVFTEEDALEVADWSDEVKVFIKNGMTTAPYRRTYITFEEDIKDTGSTRFNYHKVVTKLREVEIQNLCDPDCRRLHTLFVTPHTIPYVKWRSEPEPEPEAQVVYSVEYKEHGEYKEFKVFKTLEEAEQFADEFRMECMNEKELADMKAQGLDSREYCHGLDSRSLYHDRREIATAYIYAHKL